MMDCWPNLVPRPSLISLAIKPMLLGWLGLGLVWGVFLGEFGLEISIHERSRDSIPYNSNTFSEPAFRLNFLFVLWRLSLMEGGRGRRGGELDLRFQTESRGGWDYLRGGLLERGLTNRELLERRWNFPQT